VELTACFIASRFFSLSMKTQSSTIHFPSPQGESTMRKPSPKWNTYRTRFLVKAKQLGAPLAFIDVLGREHSGQIGDYLVESSDGGRRISPHGTLAVHRSHFGCQLLVCG
jgi:hypothetical protein